MSALPMKTTKKRRGNENTTLQKNLVEQAASVAARVLIKIYDEDIICVANIINAEALVREGNAEGYSTLCDALTSARDFLQDLINDISYGKEND